MTTVDCYKLYPCDGGIAPFTSFETFLSGYVDNYVVLEMSVPNYSGDEKCFFVKYLGDIDCSEEYAIIENTTGTCECSDCVCYSFRLINPTLVYYIDCDDNALEVYLPTGVTTTVCSKVVPYFDSEDVIVVTNNGNCISGECPSNGEIITIAPRNECDVITIFPMDVRCFSIQPSTENSFDGAVTLVITGGTPPYDIVWDTGSVAPLLTNLDMGSYEALVTDFYGDFVVKTVCVLTATTTTTTTTTTIKPLPTYGDICGSLTLRSSDPDIPNTIEQIQFEYSGYTNGYPYWVSDDLAYTISWVTGNTNQWLLSGSTPITGQIINNNPAIPPFAGWQVLGNAQIIDFTVTSGTCSGNTVEAIVTVNNILCNGKGSIVIQGLGGTPPYQYSIDNGVTYSPNPAFPNLGQGSYTVIIQDSNNVISTPQLVLVSATQPPQYSITLTLNTSTNTFQITPSSNLPTTEQIAFTVTQVSTLKYHPDTLAAPTYSNTFTFNGGLGGMTLQATSNNVNLLNLPCSNSVVPENQQTKTYFKNLTISGGQIITGTFTDLVSPIYTGYCQGSTGTYTFYIQTGANTVNCECCPVQVINPVQIVNTKV
jgi:hypothetical protein